MSNPVDRSDAGARAPEPAVAQPSSAAIPGMSVFDALLPGEMALRAERIGLAKANLGAVSTFVLGILAGAFISLGAIFALATAAGASGTLPSGLIRVLSGLAFSLGLILVIVGGAELFTGNNLIIMAWAGRKLSHAQLLRNWALVYAGNFTGAIATVALAFVSGQYAFDGGAVGALALATARHKVELGFGQAIALGILANALVCLAVWLTFSARSTTDRILAIVPPIAAFVAAGFEHSIANMYFVPLAILIRKAAPDSFWLAISSAPSEYDMITWSSFVTRNLLPVTLGNTIGGVALVGIVYWFLYLRPREG